MVFTEDRRALAELLQKFDRRITRLERKVGLTTIGVFEIRQSPDGASLEVVNTATGTRHVISE